MSTDQLALLLLSTVAVFGVVQSLFGVGLLLFGTPTLLLFGLPFDVVLAYLLPCSLAVSALQVAESGGLRLAPIRRSFLLYTAPLVIVMTAVAVRYGSVHLFRIVVGGMLLLTVISRASAFRQALATGVRRHLRPLLATLGVIHGLSNLGGGLLAAIVGSTFADKVEIRRHIAFMYGVMAGLQLVVVFATTHPHVHWWLWALLPGLAATTYLLLGRRIFRRAGTGSYHHGLTGVIGIYGVLLVAT